MAPTLWPSGDGMKTGVSELSEKRSANCRLSVASVSSLWLTAFGGPVVLDVNIRWAVSSGTSTVGSGPTAGPDAASRAPSAAATATRTEAAAAARPITSAGDSCRVRPAQMTRAGSISPKMWRRWASGVATGGVAGTWPALRVARNMTTQAAEFGSTITTTRLRRPAAERISSAAVPAACQSSDRDRVSPPLTRASSPGPSATCDSKRSINRRPVHHPASR